MNLESRIMILQRLLLQNFRSYESADYAFSPEVTFVTGANTAGKSNLIEAVYLLSIGKSFRAEKDEQLIRFGCDTARVKGVISSNVVIPKQVQDDSTSDARTLEVFLGQPGITSTQFAKRYFINGLPKRRTDFAGTLPVLLFEPSDLDLVSGSPSLRREFLDEVLEQTDREYRHDLLTYTKAIRQRNALLQRTRETGIRKDKQFSYWDEIVIRTGKSITEKRLAFIDYLNKKDKDLFLLYLKYDQSVISEERLDQYKEAEVASGVTLVGPHRDDIFLSMKKEDEEALSLKSFGSRGQQRLGVLQLKLSQLLYMQEHLEEAPVLLLDDIFSELDEEHIKHVLDIVNRQQTIITTTHKEFIDAVHIKGANVIELDNKIQEI